MPMEYILLEIIVDPLDPFREMLLYRLSEVNFDMFEDTSTGLKAYVPVDKYDINTVREILDEIRLLGADIRCREELIPWKNWNEEWERNFQPEVVAGKIYIRADFHPINPGYPIEIIIQPRMAFGTGHHPTTALVMEMMLQMDFRHKSVIDMGCGTGILAILAVKQGAGSVIAIDNDPNATNNCRENCKNNTAGHIIVIEGDAAVLKDKSCDIFIANINRNIILNDLPLYKECIKPGGELLTSGYYLQDLPMIKNRADEMGFGCIDHLVEKDWCCARFLKKY